MIKRYKILLLVLASLALFVGYVRLNIETLGDRQRIAARLQTLKTKFASNPADPRPLDEITEVVRGDWSFARTYACTVLRELGPIANAATPDLIDALNCGDGYVEREAALALGTVAVNDPRPVPALTKKLQYDISDSAWFSADSLGMIGKPAVPAIPALKNAAKSKYPSMARYATRALEN